MATVFVRRHLPKELQVMPHSLRVMELIGLWGSRVRFYRFLSIFCYGVAIVLFPKAVLGIGSSDYGAIAKGVGEFLFEFVIYAFMVIFVLKRDCFEAIIYELSDMIYKVSIAQKCINCRDVILEQNVKMRKFYEIFKIYCSLGAVGFCIPSICTAHWRFWTASNSSAPLVFDLPMEQAFYGLDIRTNFLHYHIFFVLSMISYCLSAFFTFIKIATPLLVMKYNTLAYRIVIERIRKLPKFQNEAEKSDVEMSKLMEVVDLHRQAFRITNLIEDMCQIPMALQFLTCILMYCLVMFYASTNIDVNLFNVMIISVLSLLETAGYAYLGTELTEAAEAVGTAIYDLPWYDHSVQLQRYYRLIIQRTQRKTCLTGVKFFDVGLANFSKVLNTSYSYYLVLKDVLN